MDPSNIQDVYLLLQQHLVNQLLAMRSATLPPPPLPVVPPTLPTPTPQGKFENETLLSIKLYLPLF